MPSVWDLNADLGEGDDVMDTRLLDIVTSANVACGGHAGDRASMARVCAIAVDRGVAIGAQVSYADREGFGRRRLDVAPLTLTEQLSEQIAGLRAAAAAAGADVDYVKPHGALYHASAGEPAVAEAVLDAAGGLAILTLPQGALRDAALERGVAVHAEAFADRGYRPDGSLVPRGTAGAVVSDAREIDERIRILVRSGAIVAVDGARIPMTARSLCVHSDTPGADVIAARVRAALVECGATLAAFANDGRRSA